MKLNAILKMANVLMDDSRLEALLPEILPYAHIGLAEEIIGYYGVGSNEHITDKIIYNYLLRIKEYDAYEVSVLVEYFKKR